MVRYALPVLRIPVEMPKMSLKEMSVTLLGLLLNTTWKMTYADRLAIARKQGFNG